MKSNYNKIGQYIRLVDERNFDLKVETLLGLTINKDFIPSVANTVGSDMSRYKIIRKNQFACSLMQVRRDKKIPVALQRNYKEAIISQAYPVFDVTNKDELLPEYLMMWFSRSEFDREACFYAVGGVRGSLEWEDFCNMQLPVPDIEKQKAIVKEYNTIVNRIKLNEQLNQKLEETAQAIYKQWFVEFEFPMTKEYAESIGKPELEGKAYKSNGGEMVWNEELGNEIPVGWRDGELGELANYTSKRVSLNELNSMNYISTENMLPNREGISRVNSLPNVKHVTKFHEDEILISNIRPYFKKIWRATFDGGCSNDILCIVPQVNYSPFYLYYFLENDSFFDYVMAGSKGTKMPRGDKIWIMKYQTAIPDNKVMSLFDKTIKKFASTMSDKNLDSIFLSILSELVLSKMAKA
jgi:type I restriction enzyme S subunit